MSQGVAWSRDGELDGALPEDLQARIKAELQPDERLLWSARPVRTAIDTTSGCSPRALRLWTGTMAALFLASVLFASGSLGPVDLRLVAVASGVAAVTGIFTASFGLIFGLYLLVQWSARREVASTSYALTDRRGLIWRSRPGADVVEIYTISPKSLRSIHRIERADGSGDVLFDTPAPGTAWKPNQRFVGVLDVRRVEALAREILLDPDARSRPDENRR